MNGSLYLIPTPLNTNRNKHNTPANIVKIIGSINYFIVENISNATRFIKLFREIDNIKFKELNEHTDKNELKDLLVPVLNGEDCGVLSDAGCPCIADPGSDLVALAHSHGIKVHPLIGPSSIILALMASGFVGQRFCFNGYLPKREDERVKAIKQLEVAAQKKDETQIFIETPYRVDSIIETLFKVCDGRTRICIAVDLTDDSQEIYSGTIAELRSRGIKIGKRNSIFCLI